MATNLKNMAVNASGILALAVGGFVGARIQHHFDEKAQAQALPLTPWNELSIKRPELEILKQERAISYPGECSPLWKFSTINVKEENVEDVFGCTQKDGKTIDWNWKP